MHRGSMQLDFEFMAKYLPMYAEAAELTVRVAFWGLLFSGVIGAICSVIKQYRIPVLQRSLALKPNTFPRIRQAVRNMRQREKST